MTLWNALSATLIVLTLAAVAALFLGMRPVEAGVFDTPTGGWGVDRPAPQPAPGPRGGDFGSTAGGSPNV